MGPSFVGCFETLLGEQGSRFKRVHERAQRLTLHLIDATHEVVQVKFTGVFKTRGFGEFFQRGQCVVVKVLDPFCFGLHHQCNLSLGVLGGNACGAVASVTSLGLDAAHCKHKATRTVAPVCSHGQRASDVKSAHNLATRTEFDFVSQIQTHQGVVHQSQALLHGCSHVVREFQRSRTCAALRAIDHDEVRVYARVHHGFGNAKPFPRVSNAQLKAHGFAFAQFTQLFDESHELHGIGEFGVAIGRDAIGPRRYASCLGDFGRDLGSQENATMTGFGALA